MPLLHEVVELIHGWYPPETAQDWDAVGLVYGDPDQPVNRILLAVDPVAQVAEEAVAFGADLLVTHHPLFLRPVHGFAAVTPKGRTLSRLAAGQCALLTAHTNADSAAGGVADALATAIGVRDLTPVVPSATGAPGSGMARIGDVAPTTLGEFALQVQGALPASPGGIRVAGDPERPVRRVAVAGGAGDFLLDQLAESDADVYVTSDLRHHPASEFCERGGPALIDISHWAGEWSWLPTVRDRLAAALGDTVVTSVSTIVTDPWQFCL